MPEQTGSGPICPRSAPKCTEVLPGDRKCSEMTGSNTNPPPELLRRSPKRPEVARNHPNYSEWTRSRPRRPEVVLRDRKYPSPPFEPLRIVPKGPEAGRNDRKCSEILRNVPNIPEVLRIPPGRLVCVPELLLKKRNGPHFLSEVFRSASKCDEVTGSAPMSPEPLRTGSGPILPPPIPPLKCPDVNRSDRKCLRFPPFGPPHRTAPKRPEMSRSSEKCPDVTGRDRKCRHVFSRIAPKRPEMLRSSPEVFRSFPRRPEVARKGGRKCP